MCIKGTIDYNFIVWLNAQLDTNQSDSQID